VRAGADEDSKRSDTAACAPDGCRHGSESYA